ncbi:MAG: GNAT family N-acetyltransferase [Nitrososphaerales archaeon]
MSADSQIEISLVEPNDRESLIPLLEESFEGVYLRHSKRTLRDIETVRVARINGERAGLVMLKELGKGIGYVYYIAVARRFRGQGIAGKLLDDSLERFFELGMEDIYASVEEDNEESLRLFLSREFKKTGFGELSKKHGKISSALLYMKMWVVPGEMLLHKDLFQKPSREADQNQGSK